MSGGAVLLRDAAKEERLLTRVADRCNEVEALELLRHICLPATHHIIVQNLQGLPSATSGRMSFGCRSFPSHG